MKPTRKRCPETTATAVVFQIIRRSVRPALTLALGLICFTPPLAPARPVSGGQPAQWTAFTDMPLYFEGNRGQAADPARFIARGNNCTVLIAPDEAILVTGARNGSKAVSPRERLAQDDSDSFQTRCVRIHLVGANAHARMTAADPLPGRVSYFLGDDRAAWTAGVPLFGRVQVDAVYPGIGLAYYGTERQLEYDFVLAPGALAERISLQIEGANGVRVDVAGNLVLAIDGNEIRQHKPVIYQVSRGARKEIPGGYRLTGGRTAGFWVGDYDHTLPLVIDPTLSFSTYLGGTKTDEAWGVAVDGSGNVYVAGETLSINLRSGITSAAFQTNYQGGTPNFGDAFVAKYDSTGNLGYLTYLGGKRNDAAFAIAVDPAGDAFVTGFTDSPNFPVQPTNAYQPKIAGRNNNGQHIFAIDVFVAKLDPTGTNLLYSTYLGGNSRDAGLGIAVDSALNAYVTGFTESTNFPATNSVAGPYVKNKFGITNYSGTNYHSGRGDAFVSKISADGRSLLYSSYLGGTNQDTGEGIAVDSAFNAYVVGWTFSTNFPTTDPDNTHLNQVTNKATGFTDAFVSKVAPDGQSLVYSFLFGGNHNDAALHVAVDGSANAYVTGYTYSTNFPTSITNFFAVFPGTTNAPLLLTNPTNPVAYVSKTNVNADVFVMKLDPAGTTNGGYSIVFGGRRNDQGNGIDLDAAGNAYVVGSSTSLSNFAGITQSIFPNFFTGTNNFGFSATNAAQRGAGSNDVFIVELDPNGSNFLFSAFIGGFKNDLGNGIAFDPIANAAYIAGTTLSTNFPVTNAVQPTLSNTKKTDAFVGRIQFP